MLPSLKSRRGWLLTAAVSASAGLAGAWWRSQQDMTSSRPDAAATPGAAAMWQTSFPRPGGGPPLALATLRGRPLVVNFWATWCPPCLREMPALDRFARQFAGQSWQVLGLAVDSEQAVAAYLAKNPVGYPIALAGSEGIDLSRSWGNTQGGLPFTVVLDKIGRVTHTHLGEVGEAQMVAWSASR